MSAIGPSRFWAQGNEVPEQNADAQALLPYYSYLPHRFDHPHLWTRKDCSELQEQVLLVVKVTSLHFGEGLALSCSAECCMYAEPCVDRHVIHLEPA